VEFLVDVAEMRADGLTILAVRSCLMSNALDCHTDFHYNLPWTIQRS
jgi:hypothetical protein